MKVCRNRSCLRSACLAIILTVCGVVSPLIGRADPVVIGSTPTGHLMWIANQKGFFEDQGVEVKLLEFSSGVSASNALSAGEVHLANSSEFAFVSNSLRNPGLKLVASIARINDVNLFTRKDKGIAKASDLIGRKVGLTRRGIGEFFLGEYLAINGLDIQEVELVNLRPAEIVAGLVKGNIDAGITWDPHVFKTQTALGDNFVLLPEQDSYYYHFVLTGKGIWVESHQKEVQAILRGLIKAQQFAAEEPERAQKIIAERFRLDPLFVRKTWHKFVLEVTILQSLVSLMEQEAHWLIDNGHVDGALVPNFLDIIETGPLQAVAPDAVKMIN